MCAFSPRSPLHWAAKRGHTSIVSFLLASGADKNIKNDKDQTPLDLTANKTIRELLGGRICTLHVLCCLYSTFHLFHNNNKIHLYLHLTSFLDIGMIQMVNTLRLRQSGRCFADDIFKCILLNENVWPSIKISLKFVPKVLINNNSASVQIMTWRRPVDKPLSEAMIKLPMHICVTRPQWVKIHPQGRHEHACLPQCSWLYNVGCSLSSVGKWFNHLCHLCVEKLWKLQIYCYAY